MLSMLEGGVRAAGKSAGAHNRYAVGLYAFGRRKEAIEHLREAGALAPRWPLPYANLEIILRLGGDLDGAEAARSEAKRRKESKPGKPPASERPRP